MCVNEKEKLRAACERISYSRIAASVYYGIIPHETVGRQNPPSALGGLQTLTYNDTGPGPVLPDVRAGILE